MRSVILRDDAPQALACAASQLLLLATAGGAVQRFGRESCQALAVWEAIRAVSGAAELLRGGVRPREQPQPSHVETTGPRRRFASGRLFSEPT